MAKNNTPHSSIPGGRSQPDLEQTRKKLKSLGSLGEGLGRLLEGVAELSEKGGSTREGEFSIGGPDRRMKGAYRMQFGTLEDAIAKRGGAPAPAKKPVKPFKPASEAAAEGFSPDVFETDQGAMIVFEVGRCSQDEVAITVDKDGMGAVVTAGDRSGVVAFSRPAVGESLNTSLLNGILTANLKWKD